MDDSSETVFGLLIAFLLPGFLLLWGISFSSPDVSIWLKNASPQNAPTFGAFLYLAVASLSLSLLISAIRWATVEQIMYRVWPVARSESSEENLKEDGRRAAYQDKINKYYRYYQCYSHCLIAILIAYAFNLASEYRNTSCWLFAFVAAILIVLYVKARDELRCFNLIREEILKSKSTTGR